MGKFWKDESGSNSTEYALILAIVGVGMGAAALVLANNSVFSVAQAANDLDAINDGPSETSTGPGGGTGGGSTGGGNDQGNGGANSGGQGPDKTRK